MRGTLAQSLKALGNAVGIVTLRLSEDEWAKKQGETFLPTVPTEALLAQIAVTALEIREHVLAEVPA